MATPTFDLRSLLPPYHENRLPSNGFYDGINPVVNVRGLTVKELKHLTASGRFDKKVFDTCISSCIKESLDLSSLPIQDYNYLVYLVRLYTSGNKASGVKLCDKCKTQFNFEFDAGSCAEVVYLEEPLPLTTTVPLPRFKEQHGFEVTLDVKPLTRKDFLKIDTAIRQSIENAAKLGSPVTTYPLIELLKAHVTQISGFPEPVAKDVLLDYLDATEANLITNAYPDDKFGIKGSADVVCQVCNHEQKYVIPFTDLFFS